MEFLRNRRDYADPMTLKEAILELKQDSRIDSIKSGLRKLTVTTKHIKTYPSDYSGIFIITISESLRKISIRIRKFEDHGHIAQHVWTEDGEYSEEICWGNVDDQIEIIRKNKDYYWLVRLALDLIENKPRIT